MRVPCNNFNILNTQKNLKQRKLCGNRQARIASLCILTEHEEYTNFYNKYFMSIYTEKTHINQTNPYLLKN